MIKDTIKKQIRRTGMVKELEMENKKLEIQVNNLKKEKLKVASDKLRKKYKNLVPDKLDLIDVTFQKIIPNAQSFADLGGVWGVNGGYTFYTLDKYNIKSSFLVDADITDPVVSKANEYENLTLINDKFGEDRVIEQLGALDVIFLFDVLLHQVKPDWDEILDKYSSICKCIVIYNQQFTNSENTIRLFDLGHDEYFENVPHDKDDPTYISLFENMYEIHPDYQPERIWRDILDVWQWGIVDKDLYVKLKDLGFNLEFYQNLGNFGDLKNFENHVFIFKKK